MKVPNADQAIIAQDKLCNYLLNVAHRRGASKAKLLLAMGYRPDHWQQLEADIRLQHLSAEVDTTVNTEYGTRYDILAPLLALGRQIAHVAVAGTHGEARPQVFFDGLGLGRRFDDDQVFLLPWCHERSSFNLRKAKSSGPYA